MKRMKRINMKPNLLNPLNRLTILGFSRGVNNPKPVLRPVLSLPKGQSKYPKWDYRGE